MSHFHLNSCRQNLNFYLLLNIHVWIILILFNRFFRSQSNYFNFNLICPPNFTSSLQHYLGTGNDIIRRKLKGKDSAIMEGVRITKFDFK